MGTTKLILLDSLLQENQAVSLGKGKKMRKGKGENFAVKHLKQKGWSQGEGLGRGGQGMTEAIKPKLKFDSAGLGHNRGEEFTFNWWEHVFNKAAQNVRVEEDQKGEVRVDYGNEKDLSVKKTKRKKKEGEEEKNLLYSSFVKSGTLVGGKVEEDVEKDVLVEEDLSKKISDEELVKSCGGLTAHKGARHGLKMSAKLKRIEEAENLYLKKFKEKHNKNNCDKNQITADSSDGCGTILVEEASTENRVMKQKKNKKRKREDTTNAVVEEDAIPEKKKTKKRSIAE